MKINKNYKFYKIVELKIYKGLFIKKILNEN